MGIRNGKTAIPLVIMEEHKEAYYYWHWFINEKKILQQNNILLHVDHHYDNVAGIYEFNPDILPQSLEFSKYLSYEMLGIANFIVPAIYEKLFAVWIVLKDFDEKVKFTRRFVIHNTVNSRGVERHILDGGDVDEEMGKRIDEDKAKGVATNVRAYDFYEGGLGKYLDWERFAVVLDIDLDYFCWDDRLLNAVPMKVEITKEAWDNYLHNTYNPFRIADRISTGVVQENDKYYLHFNNEGEFMCREGKITRIQVEERLDKFFNWLGRQEMIPAAIDICRSHISGYLEGEYFPWIEDEVIRRLAEMYDVQVVARPDV